MLWLVVLIVAIRPVGAVDCVHCHGNVPGCTGSTTCPLMTGVRDNAAALAATATSLVVVSKLLPTKILRALPRTVLDTIKAMVQATPGAFDFSGKEVAEVFDAVVHGSVSSGGTVSQRLFRLLQKLMICTNI